LEKLKNISDENAGLYREPVFLTHTLISSYYFISTFFTILFWLN